MMMGPPPPQPGPGGKRGPMTAMEKKALEFEYKKSMTMMWEQVRDMPFTPMTVMQFVFMTPGMMEKEHTNQLTKDVKKVFRNIFLSSVAGVVLNLQVN